MLTLIVIFSLYFQAPLYDALRALPNGSWSDYMRDGIAAILHSRVGMLNYFYFIPFTILFYFYFFTSEDCDNMLLLFPSTIDQICSLKCLVFLSFEGQKVSLFLTAFLSMLHFKGCLAEECTEGTSSGL
jgi:hypothetical protein